MESIIKKIKLFYQISSATLFSVWLFIPPYRNEALLTWKTITLLVILVFAIWLLVLVKKRERINEINEEIKKLKRR